MKYAAESVWAQIPSQDYRYRFFVECFEEKTSKHTPHFYQSRLMNVFSVSDEILIYIQEYKTEQRNKVYLQNALDEFEVCLATDCIAKELFSDTHAILETIFNKIRGDSLESEQLDRLGILCRRILTLEKSYEVRLLDALKQRLFQSDEEMDLKKGRITRKLYELTGLYVTHLSRSGHLTSYLYHRLRYFRFLNNFHSRNATQQFNYVTDALKSHACRSFDVYWATNSSTARYLQNYQELKILRDVPSRLEKIKPKFWEELRQYLVNGIDKTQLVNENETQWIQVHLSSNNYFSAAWRAKETLNQWFDVATVFHANSKVVISANCLAVTQVKGLYRVEKIDIDETITKDLTFESDTGESISDRSLQAVLSKLNAPSKEHLARSLRYLRLARDTSSLEQKFINLWVALESLFTGGRGSIIANITGYVPHAYAIAGLERRVSYLRILFNNNLSSIPESIGGELSLSRQSGFLDNSSVFTFIKNEKLVTSVVQSEMKMEHFKFRLRTIFNEFSTETPVNAVEKSSDESPRSTSDAGRKNKKEHKNKAISDRVERSKNDVERQLRRIYFLRNKIVHAGHHSNIQPQLVTHLFSYLLVCYLAIQKSAERVQQQENSLGDLLTAYKMGLEIVEARISQAEEITDYADIIPVPVI